LFTTRNDKHPSWAARRIEQLASVVEWEAQDGLPTEQKVVRWLAPSCPIRSPKRPCSKAFQVAIFVSPSAARHSHFSRLGVLWCSGPGSFCPMNGDRAAHEVTQQHYIGNDGATHGEGEGLDQVLKTPKWRGKKVWALKRHQCGPSDPLVWERSC
jgi:hypothetical protein